jgi:decaprenylphospho-beta-D-erythro-pentofuranosid-2-ulose 2-reductase
MTFIIVGASTGLGRALAEKFASEKENLIIISSDIQDLNAIKHDLELRYGVSVYPLEIDFKSLTINFEQLDNAIENLKQIKGVLLPIGVSDPVDNPMVDEKRIIEIFNINLVNVCIFVNHILKILKNEKLTIVGCGSISASRGRSRNSTYASSKRGLESFFESLRHFQYKSNKIIQFYTLGYLDTNLTFAEPLKGFKPINVYKVAEIIFKNISKDFGKKIIPIYWMPIMILLKIMPWVIFKRFKF